MDEIHRVLDDQHHCQLDDRISRMRCFRGSLMGVIRPFGGVDVLAGLPACSSMPVVRSDQPAFHLVHAAAGCDIKRRCTNIMLPDIESSPKVQGDARSELCGGCVVVRPRG